MTPAAAVEMTEVGPGPSDPVVYRGLAKRPAGPEHPYKSIHIYSEIKWKSVQVNDGRNTWNDHSYHSFHSVLAL